MPTTYEPIQSYTLGSAAPSITFSSIVGTYTDLRLVLVAKSDSAQYFGVTFNGDTTTSYSHTKLSGSGAAVNSTRDSNISRIRFYGLGDLPDTQFALTTLDIFSYAGGTNKTALATLQSDVNGTTGWVQMQVGLWRNTSAITSITLTMNSTSNFATGTTATLYGIKNA
jgi:hypothetical protein